MDRLSIGLFFIAIGWFYSMMAVDSFYNHTLGILVKHEWIKPPSFAPGQAPNISRKAGILAYGFVIIGIGLYIILFSEL